MAKSTGTYRRWIRPMLFRLPAERAHDLGKAVMRRHEVWSVLPSGAVKDPRLEIEAGGLRLPNPVGLAAGLDKNAEMLETLERLGFGYAIPGTVRDRNRQDAARPSLIRLKHDESLVNCTGLPSRGGAYMGARLRRYRSRARLRPMQVIPSIGGFTVAEYVRALDSVQPYADAIEILLLCPNERYDETNFLEERAFRSLISELNERKHRPFFVKIRNYGDPMERTRRLRLVEICADLGVDGITLPGSVTVQDGRLSRGSGNKTGRTVLENTLRNVREVFEVTEGRLAVKALGGISTGEDAFRVIAAGASSVELLTGLIYQGWRVAPSINERLLELLVLRGLSSVTELRGQESRTPTHASAIA